MELTDEKISTLELNMLYIVFTRPLIGVFILELLVILKNCELIYLVYLVIMLGTYVDIFQNKYINEQRDQIQYSRKSRPVHKGITS